MSVRVPRRLSEQVFVCLPRLWPVLALVAGLFGFAPSAHGSCGHYLRLENSAEKGTSTGERPPSPLRLPCHGPSCNRGHDQAPLTAPVLSLSRFLDKALLDESELLARVSAPLPSSSRNPLRPIHRCFPPERPPRP